jgi:hypothetical protein
MGHPILCPEDRGRGMALAPGQTVFGAAQLPLKRCPTYPHLVRQGGLKLRDTRLKVIWSNHLRGLLDAF